MTKNIKLLDIYTSFL